GRIASRDVLVVDGAIHLLVHLEELMDGVARVGVIGHGRAGHLEGARRQRVDVGDARIRSQSGRQAGSTCAEQELIGWRKAGVGASDRASLAPMNTTTNGILERERWESDEEYREAAAF